jgi:hypothetical protein
MYKLRKTILDAVNDVSYKRPISEFEILHIPIPQLARLSYSRPPANEH